jgi:outer membrane protein, heavy metal efflux system
LIEHRVRSLTAIVIASSLLAGCVRYQPRPLSAVATAAALERRSLTNAVLRTFLETNLHREFESWPAKGWDFEMLTLAAFYYHPSLEVARADWQVAQGGIRTAKGRPNPTVTVTPAYDNGIANSPSPWMPLIVFDLPLETAGKRARRTEQAEHLSESARLNIATTAWQVRSGVRSSLLDYTAAQERAQLLEKQVGLQREAGARLESQLQAGAVATAEVTAARIAQAKLNADLADARRQRAEARAGVAEALGVPSSALDGVSLALDLSALPLADSMTSAEARREALQGRSDILGALADYAAGQSALQLEIAKQYPDVHLSPGYFWNQGNEGDNQWQLGVTVELPVLNRNQGPIAEAEARRAALAARFVALQAKVIAEIDRAVAGYEASRSNLVALQSLADAQRTLHENTEAQFKAGAADQLELVSSELELETAQLAELDSRVKVHQALGALEDAVQRPIELPSSIYQSQQTNAR